MPMNRRDFLLTGTAATVAAALPRVAAAEDATFAPKPGAWRSFEITTRLEIAQPKGVSQAWVPLPSVHEAEWFRPISNEWKGNAAVTQQHRDPKYGAELVHATRNATKPAPSLAVTSHTATRSRSSARLRPR